MTRRRFKLDVAVLIAFLSAAPAAVADAVDLSSAVVVVSAGASATAKKAAQMLVEEIEKRTQVLLPTTPDWPKTKSPVILLTEVATKSVQSARFAQALGDAPTGKEGYRIRVLQDDQGVAVAVVGNDARGVLFGVGRLLRSLAMSKGTLTISSELDIATSPKYPLRGHQLGYRPKTNSYDAWDLPQWEQYYRDLIVFGANAVELLPPNTDDAATSPHFPRPPLEMMVGMSKLADEYDLEVWIWFPAMARDYADPATVKAELAEWGRVLEQLPRVDAVFVPGGDPGHTQPKHLLACLEQAKQVLRRKHANAEMWVSPQGFSQVWLDEFLGILQRDHPAWLDGVVFGPQVRISLAELRAATPPQYPIRHYPDITHSRQCQYPVPDWDVAYAVTLGRECINPRPLGQATIFRELQPQTIGFLTYSEGCNDDVNKTVWSALGWDPKAPVIDALRDYAGYFIGELYRDDFAQGLLALERNWQGPLTANVQVETTLKQFQEMERNADPSVLKNWRFQQALHRAYYDAYVRRRLLRETEAERQANDVLRSAELIGSLQAMQAAEEVLDAAAKPAVDDPVRARIVALADALFDSIRMQSSVTRHQAIHVGRGATLDTLDYPLNSRLWLKQRFDALRALPEESERLRGLQTILDWTNPGPGGFYDDLGNPASQPHLVAGLGFDHDPAFLASSHAGFAGQDNALEPDADDKEVYRMSWIDHAESMNDAPLSLRYEDLDPHAQYVVRVVYAGDGPEKRIRLDANGGLQVHPLLLKPSPIAPIEFEIPSEATKSGKLTLNWYREPGRGDNGRGCQVSEVWLIKRKPIGNPVP